MNIPSAFGDNEQCNEINLQQEERLNGKEL